MKLNWFVLFGVMLAGSVLAQQTTTPAATAPATNGTATAAAPAVTNAPATNSAGKKPSASKQTPAKKKAGAAELRTVPLVAGPAVVDANHVNVRGQAKLKSEVVTRLNRDQQVTVLEEIVKNNSGPDEPSAWAKILLPTNVHVWAHTSFIDLTNKTVSARKLNVRSGPGENFSVLGELRRGDPVKEIGTKGTWMEMEAPTNAYAFIAAQYLKQEAPGSTPVAANETPAPNTETNVVTEPPTVAAAPTEPPAVTTNAAAPPTEPLAGTNTLAAAGTNAPTEPAVEEPPPKRIVSREGVVRGTGSIQAPTKFGLYSLQNNRLIDYLYTTSLELDLRRYKGLHIVVTGEESLEERWGNNPVITIQKIQTLDE